MPETCSGSCLHLVVVKCVPVLVVGERLAGWKVYSVAMILVLFVRYFSILFNVSF